jgi:ABC-2 type transport system ATP-binding protein
MAESIIRLESVSKRFRIYHEKHSSLKENVLTMFRSRHLWEDFWALKGIDLEIPRGQMLGIIGENGSGKSTTLKLLARILRPDTGTVTVSGSLSALIELGAGFQPDFTGRENVYLNGAILGFSKREINDRFDDIVRFAELDRFIDTPVKNYSSGMYMRLGFSIAIHVNPDILLIDEILAVGDESFQAKCIDRIQEFRGAGKTIVFVSHALGAVTTLCDRVIILSGGKLVGDGSPEPTVEEYRRMMGTDHGIGQLTPAMPEQEQAQTLPPGVHESVTALDGRVDGVTQVAAWLEKRLNEPISIENLRERVVQLETTVGSSQQQGSVRDKALADLTGKLEDLENRIAILLSGGITPQPRQFGTRDVEILEVEFLDRQGEPSREFKSGEPMTIRLGYRVNNPVADPVVGVAFADQRGAVLFGSNTAIDQVRNIDLGSTGAVEIAIERLSLLGGLYFVTFAIHSPDDRVQYHRLENYYQIQIEPRRNYEGQVDLMCDWRVVPAGKNGVP